MSQVPYQLRYAAQGSQHMDSFRIKKNYPELSSNTLSIPRALSYNVIDLAGGNHLTSVPFRKYSSSLNPFALSADGLSPVLLT